MLLGSGELGREVVLELMRYGVHCVAVDRYDHAPAMQFAQESRVIDMTDPRALRAVIEEVRPDLVVPEIEAIATEELLKLEEEGVRVIPTAKAAWLTMNREGIRRLAAEELGLTTSPYRFAANKKEYDQAIAEIGTPCVVKPIMSSSGKGQSLVKAPEEADAAWEHALEAGRGKTEKVIVEGFVSFDYEITLLTLRHSGGVDFCPPIGHRQEGGDYQESWQPQPMSEKAQESARTIAAKVTEALGGWGIFGVELFVKDEEVWFSEVSPRPHDTGMVTLISQNLSEFALHARAILGLPIPKIELLGPSASHVLLGHGNSDQIAYSGLEEALAEPDVEVRLFGKPEVRGERRLGVALARAKSIQEAKAKAANAIKRLQVEL